MKREKKLSYHLLPVYAAVTILVAISILWFSYTGIRNLNYKNARTQLENSARLSLETFNSIKVQEQEIDPFCDRIGSIIGHRLTVIDKSGLVLGDSDTSAISMENHGDRPEVVAALKGDTGLSSRFSHTLNKEMLYVALPVVKEGQIVAVIRTSMPVGTIQGTISPHINRLVLSGVVLILAALAVNILVTRRISEPLRNIKSGAEKLTQGNFDPVIPRTGIKEFDDLADSMHRMGEQLDKRISTISSQRNEQQALLASMIEGVMAFDLNGNLIRMNNSAARVLGVSIIEPGRKAITELIRNDRLLQFGMKLIREKSRLEEDIEILGLKVRYIRASGAPMLDNEGNCFGIVIVLNDITRIRRLEEVRREFVGNVAHELKTPLTSIKGYVETLTDGAINRPDEALQFLNTINRQTDRLNAILEDMLRLSLIEEARVHHRIQFKPANLFQTISESTKDCKKPASEKSIKINIECDRNIILNASGEMLRQAITNLIDNAIKYSKNGKTVFIKAEKLEGEVRIIVSDNGIGIAEKHIPRLFERFYRVDKARSRLVGGTGLGLAIVKHAVLAHNGTVNVDSVLGEGSVFTILLPAASGS